MLLPKNSVVYPYLRHFMELLYPRLCLACGNHLSDGEVVLCLMCEHQLPKTCFHMMPDNPVFRKMYGRVPVENATSLFYFDKGNRVQHLMHQLKYRGKTEIGWYLGKLLGNDLHNAEAYQSIDTVIPVPLHVKKFRKRGYNQSEFFARGIAEAMKIDLTTDVLERAENTDTQTGKNRFERWENVKDAFRLRDKVSLKGKHILLVDDVITTGATLEACALVLMQTPQIRISIATIAFAH